MKRKAKLLLTVLAVCATAAFGMLASGCNVVDKVKDKIEQARCEHEWNDGEITKEATCIAVGEKTKTCSKCGKVETDEISMVEHVAIAVEAVEATCTKTGLTDGVKCAVCDKALVGQEVVPVKGHNVVTDAAVAATCTTAGKTQGSHCVNCGEVLVTQETIPATGHSLVEVKGYAATCSKAGITDGIKCSSCGVVFTGQETIAPLGHTWDEGKTITTATCATTGSIRYTCSVCGDTKLAVLPATGDHDVVAITGKAATCSETGLTDGQKCSACGKVLVKQEEIPKLAHVDSDGDLYCDVCSSFVVDTSGYTEQKITEGTSVANQYFRVYDFDDMNMSALMQVTFDETFSFGSSIGLMIGIEDGELCAFDHLYFNQIYEIKLTDIPCFIGDGYIDFYIPLGFEFSVPEWNGDEIVGYITCVVDSDCEIISVSQAEVSREVGYDKVDGIFLLIPSSN